MRAALATVVTVNWVLVSSMMVVSAAGCASADVAGAIDSGAGGGADTGVQEDAPPFFRDGTSSTGDATGGQQDVGTVDAAGDGGGGDQDGGGSGDGGSLDGGTPQSDAGSLPDGITCYPEPDESLGGDDCLDGIDKGSLSDTASSHVAIVGNLWPAGDVDWYQVTFIDSPDDASSCDGFNARIAFTATGNPGGHYAFDVFLGDCATAPICGEGADSHMGLTEFHWDDSGECPCVADPARTVTGVHICTDHSMTLTIRVYRATGAVACENYELSLDNGA